MPIFILSVIVELRDPYRSDEEPNDPLTHYLQYLYISAASLEDAFQAACSDITDGSIIDHQGKELTFESLDSNLREAYERSSGSGIWHRSGRAFSSGYEPE